MTFKKAELIAAVIKSSTIKEYCYVSTTFRQMVFINANEDIEVDDQDLDVELKINIPVHTFESFINALLELRKDFNVACAYSKEPFTYENKPSNEYLVSDKCYVFTYWHSVHNNVLYSDSMQFNVFIYLSEFERIVNLYVYQKK